MRVAARLHRPQRPHAAVGLELLAADEDQLTGRLGGAGEQAAEHHRARAGGDRLGDVAGVLDAAVADHRDARRPAGQRRLVDRGDLRRADAGHHPGGADRARPDADLDRVRAGLDQRLRRRPGWRRCRRRRPPESPTSARSLATISSTRREWPCAVSTMSTSTPASTSVIARGVRLLADADRGADQQPAVGVLGGQRVLLGLDEVLDGDQPAQHAVRRRRSAASRACCVRSRPSAASADTPTCAVISGAGS